MVGTLAPHIAYCTKAQVDLDYTLHVSGSPSAALWSSCSSRDVMCYVCFCLRFQDEIIQHFCEFLSADRACDRLGKYSLTIKHTQKKYSHDI